MNGFFEIFAAILAGFYAVIPVYGLAIIGLTLLVRIVLLPLSIRQTRSQREMQRVMPEVKAIQKKHKGDRQKINEATMALYKEHGVNPLGGCLPLLMQFPVLIALFYVIRSPLKYFGWVQDSLLAERLSDPQVSLQTHQFLGLRLDCTPQQFLGFGEAGSPIGSGITCGSGGFAIIGIAYLVLVAAMGFTTYYQQKQMQARGGVSDQQAQQMQMFGRIMPVMLMFFAFTFPTGVVLYWLTTNVWTIIQQQLMLRVVPHETPPGAGSSKASKGTKADAAKSSNGKPTATASSDGDGRKAAAKATANRSKKKKR